MTVFCAYVPRAIHKRGDGGRICRRRAIQRVERAAGLGTRLPVPSYVPAPHTRVLSLFALCQKCCRRRGLAEMRDGVVRCQLSFQPAPLSASRSAPARHHVSRRLPVRLRAHLRQARRAPQRQVVRRVCRQVASSTDSTIFSAHSRCRHGSKAERTRVSAR